MSQKKIKINKNPKSNLNEKLDKDKKIALVNSLHLIEDSDNESDNSGEISWSDNESEIKEELSEEEIDEDDEIVNIDELTKKISEEEYETVNEVKFEIVTDDKNDKNVKVSLSLDVETSNDIINIEFLITKEIFLKLAKQLK
jgi:hypothetical protein